MADKYSYALENGGTLHLEGDTPPSDKEVEDIAKQQGVKLKLAAAPLSSTITKPLSSPTAKILGTPEATPVTKPDTSDTSGVLSKIWHAMSDPLTDAPSRAANLIANKIDVPSLGRSPMLARIQGALAGATQGAGDVASSLTSPLNIIAAALTGGSSMAEESMPAAANAMRIGARVASAPVALGGAKQVLSPGSSLTDRALGLAQIAAGVAGMSQPGVGTLETSAERPVAKVPTQLPTLPRDLARATATSEAPVQSDYITPIEGMSKQEARFNKFLTASNEFPNEVFNELSTLAKEYRNYPTGSREAGMISNEMIKIKDFMEGPESTKDKLQASGVPPEQLQQITDAPKIDPRTQALLDKRSTNPVTARLQASGATPEQMDSFRDTVAANPNKAPSLFSEIMNTPRAMQIGALHLSAPFRQGLPLITTPQWWTSWGDMFKSFGSEDGYKAVMQSIYDHPNFTPDPETGKSFADMSGLRMTDSLNKREEALGAKWVGDLPGFKASSRAFTGYLNKLRSDTFNSLVDDAKATGHDPMKDLPFAQSIADFVNNATGRGSLGSLEKYSGALNNIFFAPRKIAANMQMLNPSNYIMADPFVRKQYLKAGLSTAGAWATFAGLAKASGADVSLNPSNPDFGKIKIGDTRLDPAGGFQQYLVAMDQLISGQKTSSVSGKTYDLGSKYGLATRKDVAEQFFANKLNTPVKFAYDLLNASKSRPFNVTDQAARMFIPIVAQDAIGLAKENPELLPGLAPVIFGMGEQTYSQKGKSPTMLPQSMSLNIR